MKSKVLRLVAGVGVFAPAVKRWLKVSLLLIGLLTGRSSGQVTNLDDGQSINLASLDGPNGLAVLIRDKLFADFSFAYSDSDTNAGNDMVASYFTLTAIGGPQIGFNLTSLASMTATGELSRWIVIGYSVTVTNSPGALISDVHLDFGSTVNGVAYAEVVEDVSTNGFEGFPVYQADVFNLSVVELKPADTVVPSSPQQEFWITKEIILSSQAPGPTNYATISYINQTFSQIPEPSTAALCLCNLGALVLLRRRRQPRASA